LNTIIQMRKSFLYLFLLLLMQIYSFAQNEYYVDIVLPSKTQAGQEYNVDIIVHKENITGFAKLELFLPVGIDIEPIESASSTLIKQNQVAKYIWMELPSTKEIKLTAKIKIDYRISGYKEIYGNFYCIQDKNKSKISVGVIPFQVLNDNKWKNELSAKQTVEYPKNNEDENLAPQNISAGKFYRIQIAAFRKRIPKSQLSEIYAETEHIKEEFIDGYYKYTIGDFATMEEAKAYRKKTGIYNSFIVTYENNKRVP